MSNQKITVENICQACGKGPCNEPCKLWYDCLGGKEIDVAELPRKRKCKKLRNLVDIYLLLMYNKGTIRRRYSYLWNY